MNKKYNDPSSPTGRKINKAVASEKTIRKSQTADKAKNTGQFGAAPLLGDSVQRLTKHTVIRQISPCSFEISEIAKQDGEIGYYDFGGDFHAAKIAGRPHPSKSLIEF